MSLANFITIQYNIGKSPMVSGSYGTETRIHKSAKIFRATRKWFEKSFHSSVIQVGWNIPPEKYPFSSQKLYKTPCSNKSLSIRISTNCLSFE